MSEPDAAESRDMNKSSYLTWAGFVVAVFLLFLYGASQVSVREQTQYRLAQAEQQATAMEGVELWVTWPTYLLIGDEGRVAVDVMGDVGWQRPFTLTVTLPSGIGNADGARAVEWGVGRENGRYQQFTVPLQNTALDALQTTKTITIHTTLNHTLDPLAITLESTNQAANRQFWAGVVSQNGPLLLVIAAIVSITSLVFQEQGQNRQLRLEEIKLAQQQEAREQERQKAAEKERQQQQEQQERQMRRKTAAQVSQLRLLLANANKIGLQRLWPTVDQALLPKIENHDWLTALINFSLKGELPDAETFKQIADSWPAEAAGAFLCAGAKDKALFDGIPLAKVTNPTLRNRLIQTQRGRLPLQDWPPDAHLPSDAIVRSPLDNTPLFSILKKDPLLHSRAEDELSSLFDQGAFWIEHPLYARIANATQSQIVVGGRGNGRTALARALCYYEPQYQRHYWVYLRLLSGQPTIALELRRALAEQLLQYALDKPTLLFALPDALLKLLGRLLVEALALTFVQARIERAINDGGWYQRAEEHQKESWRAVGETQLQLLAESLIADTQLPETQWPHAYVECLTALGFRGLRLALDVNGNHAETFAALHAALLSWEQAGAQATLFLPQESLATWRQHDAERQTLELAWSAAQQQELLMRRFRKLANRDPGAAFAEEAEIAFLNAAKTPREMVILWATILQTVKKWPNPAQILPEHVQQAAAELGVEIDTDRPLPETQAEPDVKAVAEADEQIQSAKMQLLNAQEKLELINKIAERFNLEEMKNLCLKLGIEFEDLGGENTRSAKARELVEYMERRGRLSELIELLKKERPSILW